MANTKKLERQKRALIRLEAQLESGVKFLSTITDDKERSAVFERNNARIKEEIKTLRNSVK